jgi:ubiquinone biosynthesis monooxygenase Coq7
MTLSTLDQFIMGFDSLLRGATRNIIGTGRPYPGQNISSPDLTTEEQKHVSGLMRVNYSGEIAAQALYLGQSLVARNDETRLSLLESAREEQDHLLWCDQRLQSLNSHTSYLNPLWFAGSFAIGVFAGLCTDKYSLGFVAETEHQVEEHLNNHLSRLPAEDKVSYAILLQMREDEKEHGIKAMKHGGVELPKFVKKAMQVPAKIMTTISYYI